MSGMSTNFPALLAMLISFVAAGPIDHAGGLTCRAGLPRMSEFKISCTDFDGLGLDGLGLVFAYTKHVHYFALQLVLKSSLEVQFNGDQVSEQKSQVGLGGLTFKPTQECSSFSTAV
ncbi:hypothetical protein B0H13DRAFT_1864256 [Mycena leptocephala]|nr:hypothetical protein B0H13DRAFT_1864256 [Mycena leptocephala]